ncbi:hypothetical protein PRIPAC_85371 [Pristionchus pacificus]|uniref:Uncharacterized protein n=1 Tax=Pristionchus pacificus TaxID=54126 RepID=A0A2A6BS78_PRIPA|nr:hypothetical protein PRIPAC_85371 [Pristionchus pacificus]|eukprot:PDM68727.1 hypothetical protein PRIPAC_47029 [Pristionchus pacificus]
MSRILIALLIASLAIAVASDGGVIPGLLGVVNQVVGLATNLLAAALPIPQGISNCAMQMELAMVNVFASTLTGFVGVFVSTATFLFGTIGIILG